MIEAIHKAGHRGLESYSIRRVRQACKAHRACASAPSLATRSPCIPSAHQPCTPCAHPLATHPATSWKHNSKRVYP